MLVINEGTVTVTFPALRTCGMLNQTVKTVSGFVHSLLFDIITRLLIVFPNNLYSVCETTPLYSVFITRMQAVVCIALFFIILPVRLL